MRTSETEQCWCGRMDSWRGALGTRAPGSRRDCGRLSAGSSESRRRALAGGHRGSAASVDARIGGRVVVQRCAVAVAVFAARDGALGHRQHERFSSRLPTMPRERIDPGEVPL